MVLAPAALAAGVFLCSSCTSSARPDAAAASSAADRATPPVSTSSAVRPPVSYTAPPEATATAKATGPVRTLPTAASTSISIPPNLCAGTDQARDAADAYMGALSAGQESQALVCVLPGTVPASVTKQLVAHQAGTAVYLPTSTALSGTEFAYSGNGKRISVTVTRESDGTFWVTGVVVH